MDAETVFKFITSFQTAIQTLTIMQHTPDMWPQQTIVLDCQTYSYIVVGAGTAGLVIANRLTEDPKVEVLVLEAGGDPPFESKLPGSVLFLKRSRFDWNFTAENDNYSGECHQKPFFEMSAGKMLGGTSSLNYMIYERGNSRDFDSWAVALNDSTWQWKNVLPYYIKSERLENQNILCNVTDKMCYGSEGYMKVSQLHHSVDKYLKAYKEYSHDIRDVNRYNNMRYNDVLLTIAQNERQSSFSSYLMPVKDRCNLHVLKNCFVKKILFDENKNAIGVEVLTAEGNVFTVKATKEIIVSAGVFNTPKLLMQSGIGPKDHLQCNNISVISDLPVGQNLQDHMSIVIVHNIEELINPLPHRGPHLYPAAGAFTGFVALNRSQNYPDYQTLTFISDSKQALYFCAFGFRYKHKICNDIYKSGLDRIQWFTHVIKLRPKSRGKVVLRSPDPADPPLIYTEYLSEEEDLEDLVKYIENFAPVMNTRYFGNVDVNMADPTVKRCGRYRAGSKDYWRCYSTCMSTGMSHYTSTCAMGSVVDSRLRVYGVRRLRVVDASVMPNITSANPYASIIMIAEKAADFIKIGS